MPPVEMLLELSKLYGLSINELVAGERLSPETLPPVADENLAGALKQNAAFQLQEQRDYWHRKWSQDHRWTWIVLIAVHGILQIAALSLKMVWVHAVIALAAIAAAVLLRNRRDDYVEHHLYDDMLDK